MTAEVEKRYSVIMCALLASKRSPDGVDVAHIAARVGCDYEEAKAIVTGLYPPLKIKEEDDGAVSL